MTEEESKIVAKFAEVKRSLLEAVEELDELQGCVLSDSGPAAAKVSARFAGYLDRAADCIDDINRLHNIQRTAQAAVQRAAAAHQETIQ
jgi:hypothetical protein